MVLGACNKRAAETTGETPLTISVAFETLQTEFWVTAINTFEAELDRRGFKMLQAVADGDASRQLDQVRNFITRKVDGIVIVPRDQARERGRDSDRLFQPAAGEK
ncbi:MAG: hypothetical protein ACREIA_12195 [Opitutaceae bacterium]